MLQQRMLLVGTIGSALLSIASCLLSCRNDKTPNERSCGDVRVSAEHCGACDHACGGTACIDGVCTPQVLAEGFDFPNDIAVDPAHVYVHAGESIFRVPLGGGAKEEIAPAIKRKQGLAVDDDAVYTFDGATRELLAIPKAGGAPRSLGRLPNGYDLSTDPSNVFVSSGAGSDAKIFRVPKTGGEPSVIATGLDFAADVAVEGEDVVFLEYGKNRIARVPKLGGRPPISIANGKSTMGGIAVADGTVAWCDTKIHTLVRGSDEPKDVASYSANDVSIRGGYAYFATGLAIPHGAVWRVALNGGEVLTLAPSPHRVESIATDERYVYWAERGHESKGGLMAASSGRILRVGR
jgi:hypothetical protein